MEKITDNVYGVLTKMKYLNYYVIVHGDVLSVVDIGVSNGDVDTLEKSLQAHNWSLEQVKHILITHAHPDHIGGLLELQRRTQAHTYVHRLDAPVIRGEKVGPVANPDELGFIGRLILRMVRNQTPPPPARVDTDLNGDETLNQVLPGLQVVHLPGHSYGHCGFWIPESCLLFGGDAMMRYLGSLRMPLRAPSPDWQAVKESIRKVAELNVDILCLGHGAPMIGNAHADIQQLANQLS